MSVTVTVGSRYSSIDWGGSEWLLHTDDLEPLALAISEALSGLRVCDGCGLVEDAGTAPDQDALGRSECCWEEEL